MDLSEAGRGAVVAAALIVMGFALGTVSRISLTNESALALLGGSATLLLLALRRGKA